MKRRHALVLSAVRMILILVPVVGSAGSIDPAGAGSDLPLGSEIGSSLSQSDAAPLRVNRMALRNVYASKVGSPYPQLHVSGFLQYSVATYRESRDGYSGCNGDGGAPPGSYFVAWDLSSAFLDVEIKCFTGGVATGVIHLTHDFYAIGPVQAHSVSLCRPAKVVQDPTWDAAICLDPLPGDYISGT
jgi:hypothetical protein